MYICNSGTQTAVVTTVVVKVENPNDVETVKVTFYPLTEKPIDVTVNGKDLNNTPNFLNLVSSQLGTSPTITEIIVKITTKPNL